MEGQPRVVSEVEPHGGEFRPTPHVPIPPDTEQNQEAERTSPGDLRKDLRTLEAIGFGLLAIGIFFAFYYARSVFFPIFLAVILKFLLGPLVRTGERFGIPNVLSAIVLIACGLAVVGVAAWQLMNPARAWLEKTPVVLDRLESRLDFMLDPLQDLNRAEATVVETTDDAAGEQVAEPVRVQVETPGLSDQLLGMTGSLLMDVVIAVILLYFLLSNGDQFLRKLVETMPGIKEKKKTVELARSIEEGISAYLLSVTVINCGLGLAIGVAMWLWGMPTPALWGAMAAILNFLPYLGALAGTTIVGLVALVSFPEAGYALLIPLTYFLLTALEGNFITPTVLGYRLDLNPVVIFVWLLLWGWIWQVAGALLAVPMLAALKIVCDHVKSLHPVGKFLVR